MKDLPSRTTFANVLKRNNYVEIEKSKPQKPLIRFERDYPNDLWQVDFKGHFGMTDGNRCYPLTVLDDCTRYSLCLDAKSNEQGPGVFESFTRLFTEFGLPKDILCDNGNPWGDSKNGYTLFEIWLMQLGILPIHIRPYRPQTQGKEERFHRTLSKELLARQQIEDILDAQEKFDKWRYVYNYIRPHHALNLDVPADHYKPSIRKMPRVPKEPEYSGANIIKVDYKGYIRINGFKYYFSESFANRYVQLETIDNHIISINYGEFSIARVNTDEGLIISKRIRRKV
ncbi:transposase InsO family protein [Anaerosolibacter carboniphilus]|uniref:Transposase InsO family protein n=1 Tax=Anaerosolibacter carboniphilus TaxID=1417629 RepID=A0A841KXH9_9FIRM|nr:integrase core domain-containing protein [Anaerosolibacter carboniphilus]MBB6218151.1 transposase InsO family protein [Anaerosolibacter carboniphilus]